MFNFIKNFEFDLKAELKNYKGEILETTLTASGDNFCEFTALSESEETLAKARVEVLKNGDTACFYVDAEIEKGASYDIRRTFFSYDSVKIYLTPKEKAQSAVGSYYFIPEKSDCWSREFFCDDIINAPKRIASLMWKKNDMNFHIMPLCDGDFKGEIHGNGRELELTLSPYTGGYRQISGKIAVLAWDKDPFVLAGKTVEAGFSYLGLARSMRKDKPLPEMFEYLGWCSWDSCRIDVTADKVAEKAKDFYDNNVPVRWFLVDDGWFTEKDGRKLWDFYVDKEKFPNGIKPFIKRLKNEYGIKYVGFWQCFSGNWEGIHPESPIVKNHSNLVYKTNGGEYLPAITDGGSFAFWNKWDSYLSAEGVDFVKVDVETNVEACTHGNIAIGRAARGAYTGMDGATAMHFKGNVINCTGMAPECLWNKPLGIMNRNSEDFIQGNLQSMKNFSTSSVYNSLYNAEFSHVDGDMLQTHDVTAKINIVLHALSGGSVYLSDHTGKTVPRLAQAFADFDGRLYRCDKIGLPVLDRLYVNPHKDNVLLKLWNVSKDSGYVGLINVDEDGRTITDTVSPSDVYGLKGSEFIMYNYFSKEHKKLNYNDKIEITLNECDTDMFQFAPITDGFAFIGNTDKYIASACVQKVTEIPKRKIFTLREGGSFAYYCENPHKLYINGIEITPEKDGVLNRFSYKAKSEIIAEFIF